MTDFAKRDPGTPNGPSREPGAESRLLESFLGEVASLTGLRICIYDLNFFLSESPKLRVPRRLLIHDSPYCHYIKSHPEAFAKCIATENRRTDRAGLARGAIIHTCHAGVTDLILPIRVDGHQIGAVFLGQAFTGGTASLRKTKEKLKRKYGFSNSGISKAAAEMPRLDRKALLKLKPLLAGITDYLEQAEELLHLRRERESWKEGKSAYETIDASEVRVERLPTPVIDRLRVGIKQAKHVQISKALAILKQTYWKNPTSKEIAQAVGMSESHFSREFRNATAMTFRQCLLETRLNAAFYLIKRSRFTIEEAAAVVGYESGCSLQRAFKNFTGLTPHRFLRAYPRAFMLERLEPGKGEAVLDD